MIQLDFTSTGVKSTCVPCDVSIEISYRRNTGRTMPEYSAEVLAPFFRHHDHREVASDGNQQTVA